MMNRKNRNRAAGWVLFGGYCALMLWLLFDRRGGVDGLDYWQQVQSSLNLVPFHTIGLFLRVLSSETYRVAAFVNLVGNVAMFIPLGFFLPALWEGLRKWWRTWLATLGIMLLVEITQLFTLRGSCDVDDLILNLAGAAMGYGVYRLIHNKRKIPG